ncbi:hypothetical protein [Streptomyces sp. NPDC021356]|uniref:hypothetical protein n=1 Tax=Streptomyces sp. NPDC021356 TaxID=3154900 RepID=UPI00340CB6CE
MALSVKPAALRATGNSWLANSTERPDLAQRIWAAGLPIPLMSGSRWLVAESRLSRGWPAASRIREEQRGPIVADPDGDRLWWLVPTDAEVELEDVRSLRVHPAGWVLHCPPVGEELKGLFWLVAPDGTGRLNDPVVVAAAFGPGGRRLPTEAPA